ncbi:MAG: hypothetical protein QG597_4289, partial [Actinomycetota bacterium]|nr:hypothetical protein [Actinomycetota bacterium]
MVRTEDRAQGKWPAALYLSRDGGASWAHAADTDSYGPVSTLLPSGQLLILPYELWPLVPGDRRN